MCERVAETAVCAPCSDPVSVRSHLFLHHEVFAGLTDSEDRRIHIGLSCADLVAGRTWEELDRSSHHYLSFARRRSTHNHYYSMKNQLPERRNNNSRTYGIVVPSEKVEKTRMVPFGG